MVQLSLPYMTTGETIALTRWTFVGKVISLLFRMKYRFVIAFLFIEGLFSCFYMVEGLKELSGAFFIRALIPFMRAPFSSSNHLPKTPPLQMPLPWGLEFQHMDLRGHKHSVYSRGFSCRDCYCHCASAVFAYWRENSTSAKADLIRISPHSGERRIGVFSAKIALSPIALETQVPALLKNLVTIPRPPRHDAKAAGLEVCNNLTHALARIVSPYANTTCYHGSISLLSTPRKGIPSAVLLEA